MSRARAFTLAELVVVIAIIGVAVGLTLPAYAAAAARYRGLRAAHELAADLDRAALHARATAGAVTVSFDPAADTALFAGMPARLDAGTDHALDLAGGFGTDLVLADFAGSSSYTIGPLGLPSAGGRVELDGGAGPIGIEVLPTTGRARVSR